MAKSIDATVLQEMDAPIGSQAALSTTWRASRRPSNSPGSELISRGFYGVVRLAMIVRNVESREPNAVIHAFSLLESSGATSASNELRMSFNCSFGRRPMGSLILLAVGLVPPASYTR